MDDDDDTDMDSDSDSDTDTDTDSNSESDSGMAEEEKDTVESPLAAQRQLSLLHSPQERERERSLRVRGSPFSRRAVPMIQARTANMRGQWRAGSVLVPVPNCKGQAPPFHLPVS
jgi:hypothetical protein